MSILHPKNVAQGLGLVLLLSSGAIGQPAIGHVVNPHYVEYTRSPDHDALVVRYDLRIFYVGAEAPMMTEDLGKVTPLPGSKIVQEPSSLQSVPIGPIMVVRVCAVGADGTGCSIESNTFERGGSTGFPSKVINLKVRARVEWPGMHTLTWGE